MSMVDRNAPAKVVSRPAITEVRNLKSGTVLDAKRLIEGLRYDRLIRLRTSLKEARLRGRARLGCAICSVPVYIVASAEKAFFFRHEIENGSCPAVTRSGLSHEDIRAMKYKGAQESDAHRRLKSMIVRSLQADSRFEAVQVEATWKGIGDMAGLRRPDVQARYNQTRIAFEAQISTTFLDVVLARKQFYRREGGLLVWVLPHFEPHSRRLMIDDVLFNNNSNVLVVDHATVSASTEARRLMVRCWYRHPFFDGDGIIWKWGNKIAGWEELHLDLIGQRSFLVDCEGEERTMQDDALRQELIDLVVTASVDGERWRAVRARFAARAMSLGGEYGPDAILRDVVRGIISARVGKPVGYDFRLLIEVAHRLFEQRKSALPAFGYALRAAKNDALLKEQDGTGKWARKAAIVREGMRGGDPSYQLEPAIAAIVSFLFPELRDSLRGRRTVLAQRPLSQL